MVLSVQTFSSLRNEIASLDVGSMSHLEKNNLIRRENERETALLDFLHRSLKHNSGLFSWFSFIEKTDLMQRSTSKCSF